MRFLKYLNEDYVGTIDDDVSIFANPSSSDFGKIRKEIRGKGRSELLVRFIADRKGHNVYVWDAYELTHADVANEIEGIMDLNSLIVGEGTIAGNKITTVYRGTVLTDKEISLENFLKRIKPWGTKYFE